jgi:hypothetical protein
MSSLGPQTHLEGKPQSFVELADVVLEVDGAQFLAHRAILAAQSRVLSELLVEVAGAQGGGANSGAAGERARPVVVVGVGRPGREGSSNGESEGSACMHLVNTSHEVSRRARSPLRSSRRGVTLGTRMPAVGHRHGKIFQHPRKREASLARL